MSQTISLFNELKTGGYDACLMTSFSIDFPFYEDVLLRRMQTSGISHHLLLVDKSMSLAAMHDRPPFKAGTHYVLAPMDCPGAFHPKVMLLLGKNKAMLAVGSHNVTLSGFGQNLEITNVLRFTKGIDEQYLMVFQQAFNAFKVWLDCYGHNLPSSVSESLSRTVQLSPWLEDKVPELQNSACQFLYSATNTDSLWQELQPNLPSNIRQVFGMSAFFDAQLEFVKEIVAMSSSAPIIGVQPDTVSAPQELVNNPEVKVVDVNTVEAIRQERRYVHAKLLHFVGDDSVFVSGSANFSRPAWLSDGSKRNAEAVLVVRGSQADEIATELCLQLLEEAPLVKEVIPQLINTPDSDIAAIRLLLIEDMGGEHVVIPIEDNWLDAHDLAYLDSFGSPRVIDAIRKPRCWEIPRSAVHAGELISVIQNKELVARIILLNVAQLRHNSAAGRERELQQAFGSLNTDIPDIDLLLKCFDRIVPKVSESNNVPQSRISNSTSAEKSEPESLLSNLEYKNLRLAESGRFRCSGGDIGLVLDTFIYKLGTGNRNDSAKAFGEDSLGRNEEDLIESEDSDDEYTAGTTPQSDEDIAIFDKVDLTCQKKLRSIINRTAKLVKAVDRSNENELGQITPIILGVLILTNEFYLAQKKQKPRERKWVTPDHLNELFEVLFLGFFSDKYPITALPNRLNDASVFQSDEWGQLLGYVAWVAYHSDVVLKPHLSIAASKEKRELLSWTNACWLFLAQRVGNDDVASIIAAKLLTSDGSKATNWLNMLAESGKQLTINQQLPIHTGFRVARSPNTAFEGYKLVTESDDKYVNLANINEIQSSQRFGVGHLDIFETFSEDEKFTLNKKNSNVDWY
jgi:hypothetical protein